MTFIQLLKTLKLHPLIDGTIANNDYIPLDLSIDNTKLKAVNVSSSVELERFIWNHMKAHKAKVAYGEMYGSTARTVFGIKFTEDLMVGVVSTI